MDDEAKAWALGIEIRGNSVSTTNVASIMAFAAEVRRETLAEAVAAEPTKPDAWERLTSDEQAIFMSGVNRLRIAIRALSPQAGPDPTAALARFFRDVWTAGRDSPLEPFDQMVSAGLLTVTGAWSSDWGYEITDTGKAALQRAEGS